MQQSETASGISMQIIKQETRFPSNNFWWRRFVSTIIKIVNENRNFKGKSLKDITSERGKQKSKRFSDQNIIKFWNKLLLHILSSKCDKSSPDPHLKTKTFKEPAEDLLYFRLPSFFLPFAIRKREKVGKGYGIFRWDLRRKLVPFHIHKHFLGKLYSNWKQSYGKRDLNNTFLNIFLR